jgi:hypothetical protein
VTLPIGRAWRHIGGYRVSSLRRLMTERDLVGDLCPLYPAVRLAAKGPRASRRGGGRVHFGLVPEHTGGVTSKYDSYWAGRLGEIRAGLQLAAAGLPVVIGLPDLRSAGERESWYGVAEVRGRGVTRSSMAHATSLGRAIAASGMCAAWPGSVFRFTIGAAGDVLTITMVRDGSGQQAGRAGPRGAAGAGQASHAGSATGNASAGDRCGHVPEWAAADRFYRMLSQLAQILPGPRRLRECHGSDDWPRQGVYFFFEPGEVRADGSDRVVRVGTHALTATSQATLWGRLRQHRGHVAGLYPGAGSHRASVFRRHAGAALIRRDNRAAQSWAGTSEHALVKTEIDAFAGLPGRPGRGLGPQVGARRSRLLRGYGGRRACSVGECSGTPPVPAHRGQEVLAWPHPEPRDTTRHCAGR